jgi:N-acetylglucosaminyldiphosphoundecaprenol N-acetyl-beta-D-mannosaminyltransferase
LTIAGSYSPPFRPLNPSERIEIASIINNSKPHLIFVSLGCPKQEYWMSEMKGVLNATMLGVGNAFLTVAGIEKRAPSWMRTNGLEWLYRFYLEPHRLWKRYFVTNSFFILYFFKALIKKRISAN